ncbi:hypothetical protein F7734_38685 [Scytonema sp. UIC 10036]|uniref:hypothetical protein n=1 Tax=Scytonema sp. UIC 10036 TaxID=2304196 RepID=UPI0012DA0E1F|nr:hypothetical protein [Scytonema sp. UIC 10036]MUG97922.1 hypothetical protein [Scytonema sp. UIC 10036]
MASTNTVSGENQHYVHRVDYFVSFLTWSLFLESDRTHDNSRSCIGIGERSGACCLFQLPISISAKSYMSGLDTTFSHEGW